jgi:hypothetical protein
MLTTVELTYVQLEAIWHRLSIKNRVEICKLFGVGVFPALCDELPVHISRDALQTALLSDEPGDKEEEPRFHGDSPDAPDFATLGPDQCVTAQGVICANCGMCVCLTASHCPTCGAHAFTPGMATEIEADVPWPAL